MMSKKTVLALFQSFRSYLCGPYEAARMGVLSCHSVLEVATASDVTCVYHEYVNYPDLRRRRVSEKKKKTPRNLMTRTSKCVFSIDSR
jgi:hypothetical protein